MSCGFYLREERALKRQIYDWKNRQRVIREEWLLLDIKINAFENKVNDMVLNRTKKGLSK